MLIVRNEFPVDDAAKRTALVQNLIGDAKITDISVIGKKTLAYPIKKQKEGIYLMVTVESPALKVQTLENAMKLGTDVLRYMLIVKGE